MSLRLRLVLLVLGAACLGVALHAALTIWPGPPLLASLRTSGAWSGAPAAPAPYSPAAWAWTVALLLPLSMGAAALALAPLMRLLRALDSVVLSYRDGDYSLGVAAEAASPHGELARLVQTHRELGSALRGQREHLAQRELLLDTVVQHTPVALVLADADNRVAYANIAARQLLAEGRSLNGADFGALQQGLPEALRSALQAGDDTLFSLPLDGSDEVFHLSQRSFRLQGRPQRLYLLRRMTRELSRQEVATWKRVIRVISHELNNSLAPISSLAHTGAELARRADATRLPEVFAAIGERAAHLHGFLDGYARFAKLPAPRPAAVDWSAFTDGLRRHAAFAIDGALPDAPGWFDAAQIEQALINLVKNAVEAGSPPDEVRLTVRVDPLEQHLELADRGSGMSETVMSQALLPFYSTKRAGTGLGLALAREIAEAHGGRIGLAHREGGGLRVWLSLPPQPPA